LAGITRIANTRFTNANFYYTNDETRIQDLLIRVQDKDPEAMVDLANAFQVGDEVDEDLDQAYLLYKSAIELDFAPAFYEYGCSLLYGKGCEKNEEEGIHWLKRAASEDKNVAAVFDLARLKFKGHPNIPKDENEAFEELKKLGKIYGVAALEVGVIYLKGKGSIERNEILGEKWLLLASSLGSNIHPNRLQELLEESE